MGLVLISYTPLNASGGVPKWNRDFIKAFPEAKHYSWWDFPYAEQGITTYNLTEWEKARTLNTWLCNRKLITSKDIVIVDGFWGLGIPYWKNIISVCHGNWSHTTKDDVDAGIQPEFPHHHAIQLKYRKDIIKNGGKLVAVSEFIADQCNLQWGFNIPVINNAIDTNKFLPAENKFQRKRPIIVHGVTNSNKGYEYISAIKDEVNADIFLLDELAQHLNLEKYKALAQADLCVIPSQHEGNSYFCLETLSCGVPIVAYAVGLPYSFVKNRHDVLPGDVIGQYWRRNVKEFTCRVKLFFDEYDEYFSNIARRYALEYDILRFNKEWKDYLLKEFNYAT